MRIEWIAGGLFGMALAVLAMLMALVIRGLLVEAWQMARGGRGRG